MCVHMCNICVCRCACLCVHRKKPYLGLWSLPLSHSTLLFGDRVSPYLKLVILAEQSNQPTPRIHLSSSPNAEVTGMYSRAWLSNVGARDLNSDLLALRAVLISTKLSPQH